MLRRTVALVVAVRKALRKRARRAKARRILKLTGSGKWEGALEEMRRDSTARRF